MHVSPNQIGRLKRQQNILSNSCAIDLSSSGHRLPERKHSQRTTSHIYPPDTVAAGGLCMTHSVLFRFDFGQLMNAYSFLNRRYQRLYS